MTVKICLFKSIKPPDEVIKHPKPRFSSALSLFFNRQTMPQIMIKFSISPQKIIFYDKKTRCKMKIRHFPPTFGLVIGLVFALIFAPQMIPLAAAQSVPVTSTKPYVPRFARVDMLPRPLDETVCARPAYPENSRRNAEEGVTVLDVTVSPEGQFVSAVIARSSGFRDLDKATLDAFAGCKFRPGLIDGKPVQAQAQMAFEWKVE